MRLRRTAILRRGALTVLLAAVLLTASGGVPTTFEYRLYREIGVPTFTVAGFVVRHLPTVLGLGIATPAVAATEEDVVRRYLDLVREQRAGAASPASEAEEARLRPLAEQVLAGQVGAVLSDERLGLGWLGLFPPVRFVFRDPPQMLIISPRDQIALKTAVPLDVELNPEQMAAVEARAERLGVAALVVPIGGLATYPAMVPPVADLPWLVTSIAHEWAHNYFTLRPLGWRYALGIERDPAVITINETSADLIGREVGRDALERFYPDVSAPPAQAPAPVDERTQRFRARMREIRLHVDALLSAGQVEQAERYMDEQREALAREGFVLRKLNQTYFAFYGSYADGPAGRLDPVVADVKQLRDRSASLHDFAAAVSGVANADELRRLVGQ